MSPEHGDAIPAIPSPAEQGAMWPRYVSLLTKNTLALILAGGRGSRLKHLTDWRAKPAVPFGGKFRIIDFPLSNCINSGIRRIGVVTQYKAHSLMRHIQRGWGFLRGEFNEFVDLLPASQRVEDSWYKGTADSVFQNVDIIRSVAPEFILVLAGDHVYKMDYGKMLADHVARLADVTVACIEVPIEQASDFGIIEVDADDQVIGFAEKPERPKASPTDPSRALASMGIYIFETSFLLAQLTRDAALSDSTHDFGRDLIPYCVANHRVVAHRFAVSCVGREEGKEPYWRDVGTVDAYWEANLDLVSVVPALNLYDAEWPIWTYQEQVPPAKFVFDDEQRRGAATDSLVAGGTVVSGSAVRRSLLFHNVRVHSFCTIDECVVLADVVIGRNCRLKRAVIDKQCRVPDGTVVGEDAAEDARRFYRTERGITLITAEMLGQRVHVTA